MSKADIGLIGLAVMGENLALNIESRGYAVSVFNRTDSKTRKFTQGRGEGKSFIPAYSVEEFTASLKRPRKVILMVKAGEVVDDFIEKLLPLLEEGDLIIDGGNSDYRDTDRRVKSLKEKGILYIGSGISGGEEGALKGPSIMPGGSPEAWPLVKEIFQKIAAVTEKGDICCQWIGSGGAGHFVKMVHNGIEYGDMQLISEAYHIMKTCLGMNNDEIGKVFREWNKGDLNSYLIEITGEIFNFKEEGHYLIDYIKDSAGQKGTGKWTAANALDLGNPLTLITEAVYARFLSSFKELRQTTSAVYAAETIDIPRNRMEVLEQLKMALFSSKIISYAQGFTLLKAADKQFDWNLNFAEIAEIWRGGCIIRSRFLDRISDAYKKDITLETLLLDPFFIEKIRSSLTGWKEIVSRAVLAGIPVPAMSSALNYFHGMSSSWVPANLIQAQRDFFGAHMYERVDRESGEFFHTDWTGRGGDTASTAYNN